MRFAQLQNRSVRRSSSRQRAGGRGWVRVEAITALARHTYEGSRKRPTSYTLKIGTRGGGGFHLASENRAEIDTAYAAAKEAIRRGSGMEDIPGHPALLRNSVTGHVILKSRAFLRGQPGFVEGQLLQPVEGKPGVFRNPKDGSVISVGD